MHDKTGLIDNGVEGCSQNTPDCIEAVGGFISHKDTMVGVEV